MLLVPALKAARTTTYRLPALRSLPLLISSKYPARAMSSDSIVKEVMDASELKEGQM